MRAKRRRLGWSKCDERREEDMMVCTHRMDGVNEWCGRDSELAWTRRG